jgi:phosphatidate cytidylyltransferase
MLKKRVITALVLASILAAAIFLLPTPWFVLVISGVAVVAVLEWADLSRPGLSRFASLLAAAAVGACSLALIFAPHIGSVVAAVVGTLVWLTQALMLKTQTPLLPFTHGVLIAGVLTMTIALANIAWLHQLSLIGPALVCVFVVIVSAADSGAYFVGRAFGKHSLAPKISPGKTIEGFAGGLLMATLASIVGMTTVTSLTLCQPWLGSPRSWVLWVLALTLIGIATAAASVVGDLTESLAKRAAGVKDSGSLLPGHGGVLDRIDGLLAGAPVFTLGVWLLGLGNSCR